MMNESLCEEHITIELELFIENTSKFYFRHMVGFIESIHAKNITPAKVIKRWEDIVKKAIPSFRYEMARQDVYIETISPEVIWQVAKLISQHYSSEVNP